MYINLYEGILIDININPGVIVHINSILLIIND